MPKFSIGMQLVLTYEVNEEIEAESDRLAIAEVRGMLTRNGVETVDLVDNRISLLYCDDISDEPEVYVPPKEQLPLPLGELK